MAAIYENGSIAFLMLTRLVIVVTARQLVAMDNVHWARRLGHAQAALSSDHVAGIVRAMLAPALRAIEMRRLRVELQALDELASDSSNKRKAVTEKIEKLVEMDTAQVEERQRHEQRIRHHRVELV